VGLISIILLLKELGYFHMSELLGTYECTIDAKGRAMLPAAFKKALQPVLENGFVLKRSVFGTSLELYAMKEWKNVMKDVNKLNRFKKENMEFIRAFTAGLKSIDIDATGRLLLPKDLMEFAGLTKDIVMTVTNNNIIEIWDKKKYEDAVNMPNEKFEALAERVMGSMGNKAEDDQVS
jgi:MraZ protein